MTKDSATLTCERCQHVWQRRDMTKLPKACPSCRSPYWQVPLTNYWLARRKKYAAKTQARKAKSLPKPPDTGIQELADRQKKFTSIRIYPDTLKVYHTNNIDILQEIKPRCNFWLPENMNPRPENKILYQPGNIIATTRPAALNVIKDLIQTNQLQADKVLWITIVKPNPMQSYTQVVTTFKLDGSDNGSWFYPWSGGIPGRPA